MSTTDSTAESRIEEIQVFRDFSRLSNRDEASTDTKNIKKNQTGMIEFPSVTNIVNCIFAWKIAQPRTISILFLNELTWTPFNPHYSGSHSYTLTRF